MTTWLDYPNLKWITLFLVGRLRFLFAIKILLINFLRFDSELFLCLCFHTVILYIKIWGSVINYPFFVAWSSDFNFGWILGAIRHWLIFMAWRFISLNLSDVWLSILHIWYFLRWLWKFSYRVPLNSTVYNLLRCYLNWPF